MNHFARDYDSPMDLYFLIEVTNQANCMWQPFFYLYSTSHAYKNHRPTTQPWHKYPPLRTDNCSNPPPAASNRRATPSYGRRWRDRGVRGPKDDFTPPTTPQNTSNHDVVDVEAAITRHIEQISWPRRRDPLPMCLVMRALPGGLVGCCVLKKILDLQRGGKSGTFFKLGMSIVAVAVKLLVLLQLTS